MAHLTFNHSKIMGICTVVPENRIKLDDEAQYYDDINKIKRLKMVVGLNERAVSSESTTPADLMEYAASRIIEGMNIDKNSIDALVCVLDNPDYKCPPTSCVLQGKLDLPTTCMSFDINHGCAGYVYGLCMACSLIENGCTRVLLLVGDTKTKTINIKDRICAPIFGDGAAATIIERSETENNSYFILGTKGKDYKNIIIPAGGARIPYSEATSKENIDEYGNIKSLNNFQMNGKNVFDFTMNTVPQNIYDTLSLADLTVNEIDYFVLHQANKNIIQNIALRIGEKDFNKVPTSTLAKYGNLAVASIPSVINDYLSDDVTNNRKTLLLSGFGVGLAYGAAVINLDKIYAPTIFTYKEKKYE
ncbi:MAG: ketoacyl-ACP synthase III [Alphaproteobacteria bacterium]|nr:ketoacyl-ACP synthase III [Alphaproteobacteria bacterium]